jgi:hypothetical protein
MKKIISLTCFISLSITFGFAQNDLSISGQIFSMIGKIPMYDQVVRVRVDSLMNEMVFTNDKGKFKILGLKKGKHKLFIEKESEAGDHYYVLFDSLIVLNKSIDKINVIVQCSYCDCLGFDSKRAINDIKKGDFRLFIMPVGISGLMTPQPNDDAFQKKYAIRYDYFACTFPEFECMGAYNAVMFEYLDKKFGKEWRKEARTDVIQLDRN